MKSEAKTPDEYIAELPEDRKEAMTKLRKICKKQLKGTEECMSYGMPAFAINGKVVAGFDGFKKHCSFFPHSGSVLDQIEGIPDWCTVGKGTLRFPIGKKLPKSLVRKLISVRRRELL